MILPLLLILVLHDGLARDATEATAALRDVPMETLSESDLRDDQVESVRSRDDDPTCDRGGTTLELNECAFEDLAKEETRMQRYLDLALEQAADSDIRSREYGEPTRQVELLTAAQTAWAAYAELRCEARGDQVQGGTIQTIVLVGCEIDATRQRTHEIWADHLTYPDSTPPMLPEPVLTVSEEQEGVAQQQQSADLALNTQYTATMNGLLPPARLLLRDAQRAWITFRDQQCRYESSGFRAESTCVARLTTERTRELRRLAQ